MSERVKTWIAWAVSVLLIAAGAWSYYAPVDGHSAMAECESRELRSVAIMVVVYAPLNVPGIDIYWLDSPFTKGGTSELPSAPAQLLKAHFIQR